MTRFGFASLRLLLAAACAPIVLAPVLAQTSKGQPNALQGFSENRGKPVQIEAASLEVRDRDKVATFGGGVNVIQGDTTMKARTLVVFYDQEATPGAMKTATPGPEGAQQIRRLEAKGSVVVTQKDQVATGDQAIFDMKANTVTLTGNVVVSKGQNVLKGERLLVNLDTGVSTITGSGLVRGIFNTDTAKDIKGGPKPADQNAVRHGPKDARSDAKQDTPRARDAARPGAPGQSPIY
jgi:lipopolysaccharide export system protein LptA